MNNKRTTKPWPTKAAMTQIYEKKLWGGHDYDFYSGTGSYDPKLVTPYLNTVIDFLSSFSSPLTVCDLGCGDFNIGKQLAPYTRHYFAIDIVEDLIKRNKRLYLSKNIEFHCLNIAQDKLPKADCAVLRHVLQHLSNNDVMRIIKKIKSFKYIILTEHIPSYNFSPNKDHISGQGIRLKQASGINLLKPPFNLNVKEERKFTEFVLKNNKGTITTTLLRMF